MHMFGFPLAGRILFQYAILHQWAMNMTSRVSSEQPTIPEERTEVTNKAAPQVHHDVPPTVLQPEATTQPVPQATSDAPLRRSDRHRRAPDRLKYDAR